MFSEAIADLNQERNVAFAPISDSIYEGFVGINGEGIKIRIDLGQGFPNTFPVISIPEDKQYRAHAFGAARKLCLFNDESVIIKPHMGNQVLIDAYDRAIRILEMDSLEQREEILREFLAYWAAKASLSYFLYINLISAVDHEFAEYMVLGQHANSLVVSSNEDESKALLADHFKNDPNKLEEYKIPCTRIRLRTTALPKMEKEFTWKSIRCFILNNITGGQKRQFNQMLSLKSRVINRILLISIPSKYGDQYACLRLYQNNPRGESLRNLNNCHVEPIISFRIDSPYMLTRCGAETTLVDKHVLLIGCGSVGGFLAENLCQCGIGALDILDTDKLSIDNVYRHALGFDDAITGKYKTDLMKARLEERFPYVDIDSLSLADRTAETMIKEPERLLAYDLIVSATGNPTINLALNDVLKRSDSYPPFVVCFNEPYGIGGHAIAVMDNGGCLRCLYSDPVSGELTSFQGSFVGDDQDFNKSLSGCAGTFVDYSALDSQQTAIITTRLVVDILKGKCTHSKIVSWLGSPEKLREYNYRTSDHYDDLERRSATSFNRFFPRAERCHICGK